MILVIHDVLLLASFAIVFHPCEGFVETTRFETNYVYLVVRIRPL